MEKRERSERLRSAIADASQRLEAPSDAAIGDPARPTPGELYVLTTPVEAAIEWLVVRYHVDDPATLLLAPADDLPFVGQCDVPLWPEFINRPLTVRCGEAGWIDAAICRGDLRIGIVPEEALSCVRRKLAAFVRDSLPDEPSTESVECDPEYLAWLDALTVAREWLKERIDWPLGIPAGEVVPLERFSATPPAWLAAEPNLALAASSGGGLMADLAESLASATTRWTEIPLQAGGALLLAADAGGVRVGWRGSEDASPPQLTGFGNRGKQIATWSNGEQPKFRRAEPDFGWLNGQVVLQAGEHNPQTITVRM